MNVVGKVGSLISQGVYSVATPFHPFGGAVDVIVVQQQDGTFRSTPWYVRFGKFQGVLKGAEKIVHINVNGIEANFHMYLDNSGEAYFIREAVCGKDGEVNRVLKDSDSPEDTQENSTIDYNNDDDSEKDNISLCRQEGSVSKNGEVQLQDENVALGVGRIERTESDLERRFYEFQDENSSLEKSVESSDYESSQYDNLDSLGHFVESQDSNSEVVLVSVDGHILTAPISSSETNTENVQLSTPQFHLGPGQETDFCEGNTDFSLGDEPWAAGCLGDLDTSTPEVPSGDTCNISKDSNTTGNHLEVCEGDGEHVCQAQENQNIVGQEREFCICNNLEHAPDSIKRRDIFKSCLELTELAMQDGNADNQDMDSPLEVHENAEDSQEKSPHSFQHADETEDGGAGDLRNRDGLFPSNSDSLSSPTHLDLQVDVESSEKIALGTVNTGSDGVSVLSVSNDQELEEKTGTALAVEGMQSSLQGTALKDESSENESVEPQTTTTNEGITSDSGIRFEISLCGNLLRAGMGLSGAAEAFDAHKISEDEFKLSAASIVKNENLVIRLEERYLPWNKAAPFVLGIAAYGLHLPVEPKDTISVEQDETSKSKDDDSGLPSTPSGRRWRLWPIPFRRVKTLEHTSSNSSSEEVFVDSESGSQNQPVVPSPTSHGGSESPHKQLLRTNVPTTEQIASLNLKEGQNMVTFTFSTRVLGMQQVDAHIYLWKWNARIVISDVDGTITKSDVLGQFMPLVGKDWTQSGVARLFSAIKENGYQLLFLSARAIVQAYLTRTFLLNLKQDGKALPSGPIVISPDGLFPSLFREVIRRAPHEFKIACLEDIRALFPSDYNPFYAGFGNRDTDELSYRKIGIPKGKIFIINPKGEVAISHRIDLKSYTSLHTLVNDMFPPTSLVEQEDYNSWNYWKMPLPDVDW
ncbi:phosphatidate phosphatase PAH1-like [Cornus florida]|uniref:phosphatidate phosphatase PAH1-like n=1 Tax=Cornus florida TaxID=4283 RepID=UPI002896E717|nr:phosphatidate phosphatase PAH1-like [Cornus florida]XP_059646976.1 phosphatidate phosphatase PAH1-like [Cornus florida]